MNSWKNVKPCVIAKVIVYLFFSIVLTMVEKSTLIMFLHNFNLLSVRLYFQYALRRRWLRPSVACCTHPNHGFAYGSSTHILIFYFLVRIGLSHRAFYNLSIDVGCLRNVEYHCNDNITKSTFNMNSKLFELDNGSKARSFRDFVKKR
jgi:hypothetical protein